MSAPVEGRHTPGPWTVLAKFDGEVVNQYSVIYVRRDRAELDCDHMNSQDDGHTYTVEPVGCGDMLRALREIAECGSHPLGWKAAKGIAIAAIARATEGDQ